MPHNAGFWTVAVAFTVVMAYSAVPTPLYGLFAERDGFGALTITLVFAVYAVGVIASLFIVGHLSDHHGRRRMLVPALALSVLSAGVFLTWEQLPGLLLSRLLTGVAVGAATATATAWLAELHASAIPDATTRRADVVAVVANLGGVGIGPLVAGALAQWVSRPLVTPFFVFGALLLVSTMAVALVPETRTVPRHERPPYRPQPMHTPPGARGPFLGSLAAAFGAFASFALFTSLAPNFLADSLDSPSLALAGLAAFLVFAGAASAQLLLAKRPGRDLALVGVAGSAVGAVAVVTAVWLPTPSLALFLVGGAVIGTGAGALFKGALTIIVQISDPARRAEILVGLFLAAYMGLAVPAVGLGLLVQQVQPRVALLAFGGLLVGCVLASVGPLLRTASRQVVARPDA